VGNHHAAAAFVVLRKAIAQCRRIGEFVITEDQDGIVDL
jgi:hypothetical protein